MDFEQLNIRETFYVIRSTYKSLDLRAILAKPKSKNSCSWRCAFLKIRLTKETPQELQQKHHDLLERYGTIDFDNFKIVLAIKNIQDFDSLLNDIKTGSITIDETDCVFPDSNRMQIESSGMTRTDLYSTPEEKSGYPQGAFFASMNESLSSLITKLGLSENDFRSKVSRLNKWMEIERNMQADVNNIVIIFPVYCRQVNGISSQDREKKIIARYEIHKDLAKNSNATITKSAYMSMQEEPSRPIKLSERIETSSDDMVTVTLEHRYNAISPDDTLKAEIRHVTLGVIEDDPLDTDAIIHAPYNVDSLLDGFLLLSIKDKLKQRIVSKNDKRQEIATSWLMTLLGLRTIYPGRLDKDDERIMGTEYTIDLLCHYCESIILIVDCTVSAVDDKQIDTLKNTSTYISKKIGKKVISLIVSSEDCSQKKQTSGVPIMDKNDCEHISDLLLKGHSVQAKQFFSELVFRNPQTE